MAVTLFDPPYPKTSYYVETHDSTFYGTQFNADQILHCRNLAPFCSCDLDLDPMTFIYELDRYPLKITCRPKMDFISRLSKVIVAYCMHTYVHTDIHTDRQTDRCHRFASGNKNSAF